MTIRLTNGKNGFFGTFSYANSQWIVSVNCRQIIMVEVLLCLRWKISLICNCKQVVVLVEFHEFFPKLSWAYWQRVIIASITKFCEIEIIVFEEQRVEWASEETSKVHFNKTTLFVQIVCETNNCGTNVCELVLEKIVICGTNVCEFNIILSNCGTNVCEWGLSWEKKNFFISNKQSFLVV